MSRLLARLTVCAALLVLFLLLVPVQAAGPFPLKDGDLWVMVGDSITAQHLHSNYFEAFCYVRYPKLTFAFRNSGVGGDTIPKVLARYDWDVAAWKPTVISVELGMNDQGGYSVPQFIDNMKQLSERIRSSGARPVFLTSSPINNGDTMAKLAGNSGNAKLSQFAIALKAVAMEQNAPFSDQFHAVIDVWGKNKPRESLAILIGTVQQAAKDEKLTGVEHLRAFLTEQGKDLEPKVAMQGDAVHPGPPGQLIMAAALLKELSAEPMVSTASIDSQGKIGETNRCTISAIKAVDGKLTFDRLDECLPFPIPDEARNVLPLFPTILELSEYTLQVTGLPAERYEIKVNGQRVAVLSAKELASGVNLTAFAEGPIAAQSKAVLAAVGAKEGLVSQWRGQSRSMATSDSAADAKSRLDALSRQVEEADGKIREAAKPRTLHFELSPLKA